MRLLFSGALLLASCTFRVEVPDVKVDISVTDAGVDVRHQLVPWGTQPPPKNEDDGGA